MLISKEWSILKVYVRHGPEQKKAELLSDYLRVYLKLFRVGKSRTVEFSFKFIFIIRKKGQDFERTERKNEGSLLDSVGEEQLARVLDSLKSVKTS